MTFVRSQCAALGLPLAKVMADTCRVPVWLILWELAPGHAPPPLNVLSGVVLIVTALGLPLKDEGRGPARCKR